MKEVRCKSGRVLRFFLFAALALVAAVVPASAQKKDKNKNAPPDSGTEQTIALPMPDSQAIDQVIGEALGYWQIGDTASLHKYYADDVVLVSGAWPGPPDPGGPGLAAGGADLRLQPRARLVHPHVADAQPARRVVSRSRRPA